MLWLTLRSTLQSRRPRGVLCRLPFTKSDSLLIGAQRAAGGRREGGRERGRCPLAAHYPTRYHHTPRGLSKFATLGRPIKGGKLQQQHSSKQRRKCQFFHTDLLPYILPPLLGRQRPKVMEVAHRPRRKDGGGNTLWGCGGRPLASRAKKSRNWLSMLLCCFLKPPTQ